MTNNLKKDNNLTILENIVQILKDNNLSEIEYETNDLKIEVKAMEQVRTSNNTSSINNTPNINIVPNDNNINKLDSTINTKLEDLSQHPGAVKSPMVGTCYLAPEPGAKNFVEIGDIVKKDQPLLIIEAMKVMNYIRAKNDGKIINISVKDAQPVEYGQLLLVIE